MARTYNKSRNTKPASAKSVQTAPEKMAEVKKAAPAPVKHEAPSKTVIAAPEKEVLRQIVYQPSSQILTREVGSDEAFAIGDDMPIYYL